MLANYSQTDDETNRGSGSPIPPTYRQEQGRPFCSERDKPRTRLLWCVRVILPMFPVHVYVYTNLF